MNNTKVVIHPDKINRFCLKPDAKHADDFFNVGYTTKDYDLLYNDIVANFDENSIVDVVTFDSGAVKFSVFMDLGVGTKKRFRTVWQKDTAESAPRFITAHRED